MKRSQDRPFQPAEEQLALFPKISGNRINGLGEDLPRRATPVYWRDPDSIPHGPLQRYFYTRNPDDPAIDALRAERQAILDEPLAPLADRPMSCSGEQASEALHRFARDLDLDLLGVTPLDPKWLFEDAELDHGHVIVIGVAHDPDEMAHAPETRAGLEVIRQYTRGARAAKQIASWVQQRGWPAQAHTGPFAGKLLMVPPAIACGFGQLGKHGSIINDRFGSSFRLACVTTDMPLAATQEKALDVDDFCSRCKVCENACPPNAIAADKQMVRGELKWYVDFDRCIAFFNEHFGCGICIAVCPWSLPGRAPRIVQQLARRAARRAGSDSTGD